MSKTTRIELLELKLLEYMILAYVGLAKFEKHLLGVIPVSLSNV